MSINTSTADKTKSFIMAVIIYFIMIMILVFIRFWPPSNPAELATLIESNGGGGVTINFGDSNVGAGNNFKSEALNVKAVIKQTASTPQVEDKIIAQENNSNDNDVVVTKKEPIKKDREVVKEQPKPAVIKPKINKNTNDALANILSGSNKGGDGDDNQNGNKGKTNGSLSSNDYYGKGSGNGSGDGNGSGSGAGSGSGSGGGVGYSLGNRKALSKPAPKYTCNESGKVVVEVSVDKNGNTISAVAGVKGTTNTAKCLLDQARIAAMNTKWQPSEDAPDRQVGKIVYSFSLN